MEKLRSPSPLLVDTTARFIFLPTVPEMKPRTECACQAVAFMISFKVAPPGRCSRSRILPVLLPGRTPFSLAAFSRRAAFFAPLDAFLAGAGFFPALPLLGAAVRAG